MIRFLALFAALASLSLAATPAPTFHGAYFVGLTNPAVLRAADARLDYALGAAQGGQLQFKSIADVDRTKEESVAPADFTLWRLLQANCAALKKFESGRAAASSNFPPTLTETLVAAFPAAAVPAASDGDEAARAGQTLKQHEEKVAVALHGADEAEATTTTDLWKYFVLARADFDGDGAEDLLVRVDWRSLEGSAAGSESFVLAKPAADGAVKVVWRSTLPTVTGCGK